jgi:hypothetical protein
MAYAASHFSYWEADDGLGGRQLSSSLPLLKHAFPRNSLMDWKKRGLRETSPLSAEIGDPGTLGDTPDSGCVPAIFCASCLKSCAESKAL